MSGGLHPPHIKKGTASEVACRLQIASKMFVALFNCPGFTMAARVGHTPDGEEKSYSRWRLA